MHEINRLLRAASLRLLALGWLRWSIFLLSAACVGLVFAKGVEKLSPWDLPWPAMASIAAAAVLLLGLAVAFFRRPTGPELAEEVDRRAGLRETISTAVLIQKETDAWSRAVVESASRRARGVSLREAIPIEPPRTWWVPIALLALLGGMWFLPRYDLSGVLAEREAAREEEREMQLAAADVRAKEKALEEILSRAGVELEDEGETSAGEEAADEQRPPRSADDVRRAAIKKLTNRTEQLRKLAENEQAQQLEQLKENLARLKTPGPGPLSEFGRSLARGNFKDAREQLEQAAEQIASGEMSDEEKKQAERQLRSLKDQLEQLAQNQDELREKLEQLGLDQQQAQRLSENPEAMQQALEQMQGLSEEQKQQLQQLAQNQQAAGQAMQGMAGAMGQMAQGMQSPQGLGGEGQSAMEALGSQLGGMEMAEADLNTIQQALGEASSQLGEIGQSLCEGGNGIGDTPGGSNRRGRFREGSSQTLSEGSGGAGRGSGGGNPEDTPGDYVLKREKASVTTGDGPIIGSTVVYGAQVRGESKAQFGEAVTSGAVQAADAIETKRVPREYHDAVRHYFGRLEAAARSEQAQSSTPEDDG